TASDRAEPAGRDHPQGLYPPICPGRRLYDRRRRRGSAERSRPPVPHRSGRSVKVMHAAAAMVPDVAALRDAYLRDGFVAVRNLIPAAELADPAGAVDSAVADRKSRDHRSLQEKSRYEQSFLQCQYLWEDHPDIRPLTFHPRICALAGALM